MNTTIIFTQGHISIRRGRIVRQYHNPTHTSIQRMHTLVHSGDNHRMSLCDVTYTNRSVQYNWHGIRSLTVAQLRVVRAYDTAIRLGSINYDDRSDYMWGYIMAWQDVFRAMDIHPYHLHT